MFTTIRILIIPVLFVLIAGCGSKINKQVNSKAKDSIKMVVKKFEITITNYNFGRAEVVTTINQDSLYSINNFNEEKKKDKYRALTKKEIKTVSDFLSGFPLTKLKSEYMYSGVKDGTVIGFSITINDHHKEILTGNYYQKDLGALVKVLSLLFDGNDFGYNLLNVPYTGENN